MSLPSVSNLGALGKTVGAYAKDLAERVLSTFVVTAAGVLVTAKAGDMGHVTFWQGVGTAGLAAAFSLVKGVVAKFRGDGNSASLVKGV
jgi:hypothetical protein